MRVLIIGESSAGDVCDVYRTSMYVDPLRRLGVDVRYATTSINADGPLGPEDYEAATASSLDRLTAEVDGSDVIVFRRWYATHILCLDCGFATIDAALASAHARTTAHALNVAPQAVVRRLLDLVERDGIAGRIPAIVYETDDDLLRMDGSNGQSRGFKHERDLVERMISRADLVTVSTPVLATRIARRTAEVRVVRNAIDPRWYADGFAAADEVGAGTGPASDTRICYYGSIGRLRDYAVCAGAVDLAARAGARRIWFGAPALEAEVPPVAASFDEVHPYVTGVPAFARHLRDLRPSIGLAPLVDSPFARARSELHWLEYTMAGAVTVASRLGGPGPYDVIDHGVDGFLAEGGAAWRSTLERVARSADLRAEVAARARARVLAEYDVEVRALEWADAYRHAAANTGRGATRERRPGDARGANARSRPQERGTRDRGVVEAATAPSRKGHPLEAVVPTPAATAGILEAYIAAGAFAGRSPLRLRLGVAGVEDTAPPAGSHPDDGWVSIDTAGAPDLVHDVMYGLPFSDGSVDAIEAGDVLERLGPLASLLAGEAARVLRPGGTLGVVMADRLAALAHMQELQVQGVDLVGRSARLPVFSAQSLELLLRRSGFEELRIDVTGAGVLTALATR